MKKLFLLLIISLGFFSSQAQEIAASTARIGVFKLGMKQAEVEKIINKPISKNDLIKCDSIYNYYINVSLDSVVYQLHFMQNFERDSGEIINYQLQAVKCNSNKLKTKLGLTIGLNKLKAMELFDKTKISYSYSKSYTLDEKTKKQDKVLEFIQLIDNTTYDSLFLHMENGIIVSFELRIEEYGC